jgi:hypothetical protein
MMRLMKRLPRVAAGMAGSVLLVALAACGGGAKQADAPGTCPEGTVLQGGDCLPESAARAKSGGDEDSPKGNKRASDDKPAAHKASTAADEGDLSGDGASYDKEAVEAQLKRAAKQVKSACGSASDEEGNKTGPWGATAATVVLGRNGHVKEVTVPAPYAGKPVGDCVVNSFKKIWFPPYAGSSDVSVNWDVEIVQPKKK